MYKTCGTSPKNLSVQNKCSAKIQTALGHRESTPCGKDHLLLNIKILIP